MDDPLYNTLMSARMALIEQSVKAQDAIARIDAYMGAMPAPDPVERVLELMREMPERRDLYEAQGGGWYVTYSGEAKPYKGLTKEQVEGLASTGVIELLYPGAYKLAGARREEVKPRKAKR